MFVLRAAFDPFDLALKPWISKAASRTSLRSNGSNASVSKVRLSCDASSANSRSCSKAAATAGEIGAGWPASCLSCFGLRPSSAV